MSENSLDSNYVLHSVVGSEETHEAFLYTIVYVYKLLWDKGHMFGIVKDSDIKTEYPSTNKLIKVAINGMCTGVVQSVYNFMLKMELLKAVVLKKDIQEDELEEIYLAYNFLILMRINDYESFYILLKYVCTTSKHKNALFSNLIPDYDEWKKLFNKTTINAEQKTGADMAVMSNDEVLKLISSYSSKQ